MVLQGPGCMCGALTGSVMMLSMFFGRTEPGGPQAAKNACNYPINCTTGSVRPTVNMRGIVVF